MPDELKKATSDALQAEESALVDAALVANELPNMPHLELSRSPKAKEAALAP